MQQFINKLLTVHSGKMCLWSIQLISVNNILKVSTQLNNSANILFYIASLVHKFQYNVITVITSHAVKNTHILFLLNIFAMDRHFCIKLHSCTRQWQLHIPIILKLSVQKLCTLYQKNPASLATNLIICCIEI